MDKIEIADAIRKLKKRKEKVFTNNFMQFQKTQDVSWEAALSERSLCLINEDHGVNRVLFYTTDFHDLNILVQDFLDPNEEYVLDIVSKDSQQYCEEMEQMGFRRYKKVMRMSNQDIASVLVSDSPLMEYYTTLNGERAMVSDTKLINGKLWEIFDSRVSHLLTDEELEDHIRNGEVFIHKNEMGEVVAILQRVEEPRSFYINQIYNGGEPRVIHSILLDELKQYHDKGGKYVYAWVEEDNPASIRFHEKYGLRHDSLWDIIYIRGAVS